MEVRVIIFGRLTDIVGSTSITIPGVDTTNDLVKEMSQRYPALANAKYAIAVNRQVIHEPAQLDKNSIVALLPPSSGG
jgi:sulfur-carrier protein